MAEQPDIDAAGTSGGLRRDRGATFLEILMSIVLLGIAGVAVLVGISAALRGTATHDRVATAQANLADAGDQLTDVTLNADNYVDCATPTSYQPIAGAFGVNVVSVSHWDGSSWVDAATCPAGSNVLQRVALSVNVDGVDRELTVVKRKATVANGADGAWNDLIVTPTPHPQLP